MCEVKLLLQPHLSESLGFLPTTKSSIKSFGASSQVHHHSINHVICIHLCIPLYRHHNLKVGSCKTTWDTNSMRVTVVLTNSALHYAFCVVRTYNAEHVNTL